MSLSGSASAVPRLNATLPLLSAAFVVLVLLRIGLNALILNQFMDYTTVEGSVIEKIHPAFYGIVLVAAGIAVTQRIELTLRDLAILRAVIVFVAGIAALLAMMIVNGRSGSAGYILDTYIVACLASFVLIAMPDAWRMRLGELVVLFFVLSAAVGIVEFLFKARLLPYPGGEAGFRPVGLTDHPLQFGLWCAVAICFARAIRMQPLRWLAVAILLVGALASGARVATLAAGASAVIFLIFEPIAAPTRIDAMQRKMMLAILGLVGLIAAVAAMAAIGALDRLFGGLVDESALARVGIYGVFDFLTWREFLLGADIARVQRLALDVFNLPYIESSFVILTIQFGLLGAILFFALLGNLVRAWLSGRSMPVILGTMIYFGVALTNNQLSVKSADIMILAILIMADCSTRSRAGRAR